MLAEFACKGLSAMPYTFVIANDQGETLMEVPFTERLHDPRRQVRFNQHERARQLSQEIAEAINAARETTQRSREILARAREIS